MRRLKVVLDSEAVILEECNRSVLAVLRLMGMQ